MRLKRSLAVITTLLVLPSIVMGFLKYQSNVKANQIFSNMSYISNSSYFSNKVSLVNGIYEWSYESPDGPFISYYLQYTGQYVYGDFNRDGLRDAAVILVENSGGNAGWYKLAFLIHDGKTLVHRASRDLDDRAIINSLKEDKGKAVIDMFVHQGPDCMSGPTCHVKKVLEYHSGTIEEKQLLAKSLLDPLILILKKPTSWAYVFSRWRGSV